MLRPWLAELPKVKDYAHSIKQCVQFYEFSFFSSLFFKQMRSMNGCLIQFIFHPTIPVFEIWLHFPFFLGPLSSTVIAIIFNTLRPRQNGRHFTDDIFKWIFANENVSITIKISLKFVPKGSINNIRALVQIMAWRQPGDKPLSEPMMVILPTHICVTRPQWVKKKWP